MNDRNPLVSLQGAGVRRDGRWLVRDVDLSLGPREILTLVGPNGAGKTTTAKVALGLMKPDAGTARRRPDLKVGYVPQKLAIDWTMPLSVGRFMGLTGRVAAEDSRFALTLTGVAHLRDAEMLTLSGGELRRVMLARAIARRPDLLVLDEPVQGVDFAGEIALYELIGRIRNDMDCGILLISHDLHIVMAESDRVICLNGHICCEGPPSAVAESAEYRALVGTRAAETLALYTHRHDHTHGPDGEVRAHSGCDHDHPEKAPAASPLARVTSHHA